MISGFGSRSGSAQIGCLVFLIGPSVSIRSLELCAPRCACLRHLTGGRFSFSPNNWLVLRSHQGPPIAWLRFYGPSVTFVFPHFESLPTFSESPPQVGDSSPLTLVRWNLSRVPFMLLLFGFSALWLGFFLVQLLQGLPLFFYFPPPLLGDLESRECSGNRPCPLRQKHNPPGTTAFFFLTSAHGIQLFFFSCFSPFCFFFRQAVKGLLPFSCPLSASPDPVAVDPCPLSHCNLLRYAIPFVQQRPAEPGLSPVPIF